MCFRLMQRPKGSFCAPAAEAAASGLVCTSYSSSKMNPSEEQQHLLLVYAKRPLAHGSAGRGQCLSKAFPCFSILVSFPPLTPGMWMVRVVHLHCSGLVIPRDAQNQSRSSLTCLFLTFNLSVVLGVHPEGTAEDP